MEFCRVCGASAEIVGFLPNLDSLQGQLGKGMIGERKEEHELNETNPELCRAYEVLLSSL